MGRGPKLESTVPVTESFDWKGPAVARRARLTPNPARPGPTQGAASDGNTPPFAHAGDQEEKGLGRTEHGEGDSDHGMASPPNAPPATAPRAGITTVPNVGPARVEPEGSSKMFAMAVIPPDR
jgi:hypothetical protein